MKKAPSWEGAQELTNEANEEHLIFNISNQKSQTCLDEKANSLN